MPQSYPIPNLNYPSQYAGQKWLLGLGPLSIKKAKPLGLAWFSYLELVT
jgi:hypothetical protein